MVPRLYRPRTDRMIGGVCGGLGLYFGLDPVIVRLLFVVLAFTTGLTFVLYPILWIVMPSASSLHTLSEGAAPPGVSDPAATGQTVRLQSGQVGRVGAPRNRVLALVLLGVGMLILISNIGHALGVDVAGFVIPALLIGLGVYLLRGGRG